MRTLIIAEAGVNHNGSLDMARQLVAEAAAAGADVVKFQTFVAEKSIAGWAPKAKYQVDTTGGNESQYEMVKRLELSAEDHVALLAQCEVHGVEFLSTAFDVESFDLLLKMGPARVKIPSGEITNLPLLRHMAATGRELILSTGMATLGEVEAALGVVERAGTARERVTILHCTTEYPSPMEDVNLRAMIGLGRAFGLRYGYSDHTLGIEIPTAAVALGATVIEKHLTLDRSLSGPDHRASLEPAEFKAMVSAIRNVEAALGDGIKRPSASESKNKPIARKSLVACRAIAKGEAFSEENLTAKRPGTGLSPMLWDEVLGRKAPKDFAMDEQIFL